MLLNRFISGPPLNVGLVWQTQSTTNQREGLYFKKLSWTRVIIGYLTDACQILLLFAEMKTNTNAKAKRVMKASYTQLSFDL
jgi:hypothetical protein